MKDVLSKPVIIHLELKRWHILLSILFFIFSGYIVWQIYWYNKVGLYFIKWHTHIVFTALTAGGIWLLFLLFHLILKKPITYKALTVVASIAFALVLGETLLTLTGANKNYMETSRGFYQSPYAHDSLNYYLVYPNSTKNLTTSEYSYPRSYNSLGFSDSEWEIPNQNNAIRILTLGDSFTEGDGAEAESAYPAILSKLLKNEFDNIEVLNAGICGSDPVFNFKNLEDRLLEFRPNIVVQTITENDLSYDFIIRGGFERFVSDSIVKFKKAPWWEPVYAMSYISRIFFHLCGQNITNPDPYNDADFMGNSNKLLIEITEKFHNLASVYNFQIVYVLLPMKHEFREKSHIYDYSILQEYVVNNTGIEVLDLLPCYINYSDTSGRPYSEFYWVIDGHHNATGYKMMAECIADTLKPMITELLKNKSETPETQDVLVSEN